MYKELLTFNFPTTEMTSECMEAIGKFEPWDTAHQYGAYGYYVTITSAVKNIEKVLSVIAIFGRKLCKKHDPQNLDK